MQSFSCQTRFQNQKKEPFLDVGLASYRLHKVFKSIAKNSIKCIFAFEGSSLEKCNDLKTNSMDYPKRNVLIILILGFYIHPFRKMRERISLEMNHLVLSYLSISAIHRFPDYDHCNNTLKRKIIVEFNAFCGLINYHFDEKGKRYLVNNQLFFWIVQ